MSVAEGAAPATPAPHVVVVGAGVAGAAAAWTLRAEGPPDLRITVVEATDRLGGKLRSSTWDVLDAPVALEEGAETFLARRPEAVGLAAAVRLGAQLVHPGVTDAALWTRGRLRPLPPGTLMGVPTSPLALVRSGVLSPRATARAALDVVLPPTPRHGDLSVGALVGRRMGRDIVDQLVDPLLGGVYAGRADALSLEATVPQLAARRDRTLLAAARAVRRAAGQASTAAAGAPMFATVQTGLQRLPEAALAASGATVRTGATATGLERRPGGGWHVTLAASAPAGSPPGGSAATGVAGVADPHPLDADGVVLAVPAPPAGRLLRPVSPDAADLLAGVAYASMVLVTLAYRGERALPGSGFLVPAVEGRLVKAATFLTAKWPHLAAQLPGWTLVRASVGRFGDVAELQREDRDLARAVSVELGLATGLPARPDAWRLTRWGGALPQYPVGHLARMHAVREALAREPGLAVCGAAYDGVGIPACVGSGQRAARRVLASLPATTAAAPPASLP